MFALEVVEKKRRLFHVFQGSVQKQNSESNVEVEFVFFFVGNMGYV